MGGGLGRLVEEWATGPARKEGEGMGQRPIGQGKGEENIFFFSFSVFKPFATQVKFKLNFKFKPSINTIK